MWRRSGNGQEIPHGRRDLQNNVSAARHFNRTVFLKKEKSKKEATGVLAMKETLFSDGRSEEPTVQYNTESAAFLRVSTLNNACILLIIY